MLACNNIQYEGGRALAEVLTFNNIINSYNLSQIIQYIIDGNRIYFTGAETLGESLKFNNSIRELNLCNIILIVAKCNIGDEGATILAELLQANHSIISINLSKIIRYNIGDNQIACNGAKALSIFIEFNDTINSIDLCNINITLQRTIKLVLMVQRK